jgi:hypothetical protein
LVSAFPHPSLPSRSQRAVGWAAIKTMPNSTPCCLLGGGVLEAIEELVLAAFNPRQQHVFEHLNDQSMPIDARHELLYGSRQLRKLTAAL